MKANSGKENQSRFESFPSLDPSTKSTSPPPIMAPEPASSLASVLTPPRQIADTDRAGTVDGACKLLPHTVQASTADHANKWKRFLEPIALKAGNHSNSVNY